LTSGVATLSVDPKLIERATLRLRTHASLESGEILQIGPPSNRHHSTIWPLCRPTTSGVESIIAYYKQLRVDWADASIREGLERSERLTPQLAQVLAPRDIVPASVLAVDVDRGAIITEALHGEAVRGWGTFAQRVWHRDATFQQLQMLGYTARRIEEIGHPRQSKADDAREAWHFGNDLKRAGALGAGLPSLLTGLFDKASASMAYTHGDLSDTNVLTLRSGLGIIDIGWKVRLKGFDIACLSHRLEFGTQAPARWRRQAVAAVLEGYGNLGDAEEGWRFYRMQRLLRVADRGRPPAARRARRLLFEAAREDR
jgi:hypothetical protein